MIKYNINEIEVNGNENKLPMLMDMDMDMECIKCTIKRDVFASNMLPIHDPAIYLFCSTYLLYDQNQNKFETYLIYACNMYCIVLYLL